jgi:hypothetical protein
MTPEAKVKQEIKAHLAGVEGLWFFMPVPTGYGMRGIPDFVGCYRGRFFAIEAKSDIGKLSPWQERVRDKITLAGGLWLLARSAGDVTHVFQ